MILWLLSPSKSSSNKEVIIRHLKEAGVVSSNVRFVTPRDHFTSIWVSKPGTALYTLNPTVYEEFMAWLSGVVAKANPKVIVINDIFLLHCIEEHVGQKLEKYNGYTYRLCDVPAVVIDNAGKTYNEFLTTNIYRDGWIFKQVCKKIARIAAGNLRPMPKFAYEVADTWQKVSVLPEMFKDIATPIAIDIETSGLYITAISLCRLTPEGHIYNVVIPFVNLTGCHWPDVEDELAVWQTLRIILQNNSPKIFHNGTYDVTLLLRYGCAPVNFYLDTLHVFHSLWSDMPKSLAFCASLLLDYCAFWKDEVKGDDKEAKYAVPRTTAGLQRYWFYNALDTYYTLMVAYYSLQLINHPKYAWAKANYITEMLLQFGPAMMMSAHGMAIDADVRDHTLTRLHNQALKGKARLAYLMESDGFNPNSPIHAWQTYYMLLPDMRPKGMRLKPVADKKTIRIIADESPLHEIMLQAFVQAKEPAANVSKYGTKFRALNGRFHYSLGIAGTAYGRFSGRDHPLGYGTNPQNVPGDMRQLFCADEDHILVEIDYSQSDFVFVAYAAEDEEMIRVVNSGMDSHAIHCEMLLGVPYAEVVKGKKADDPRITHPVTGVRQIIKKVVHGTNYLMGPSTMVKNVGKPSLTAAAITAGYQNVWQWAAEDFERFARELQHKYSARYRKWEKWKRRIVTDCVHNGNLATCAGGRTHFFFEDLLKSQQTGRTLAAFYGQGGTAGNINRAMARLYYGTDILQQGARFLLQVHDSLVFSIPKGKLHLINQICNIMAEPVTFKGQGFSVPVEASLSHHWGKKAVPWKGLDDTTKTQAWYLQQIDAIAQQVRSKAYE